MALPVLNRALSWNRRHILATLGLALIPAFAFTAVLSAAYHRQQRALSAAWADAGARASREGRPDRAIEALRNALGFAHGDPRLLLQLARALRAAARPAEARSYLLTLWADQPGDGAINLELGRLAAAEHDVPSAIRYYHGAIEGAWDTRGESQRRGARMELLRFLTASGAMPAARVEVAALEDDLPDDAASRREIAALMASAGVPDRALGVYQGILRDAPRDQATLVAAGRLAMTLGRYQLASTYFDHALATGAVDGDLVRQREVAHLVVALDPTQRRLSGADRVARGRRAYAVAASRLDRCTAAGADASATMLKAERTTLDPLARSRALRDAETLDRVFDFAFGVARATSGCDDASPEEQALRLLARQREEPLR